MYDLCEGLRWLAMLLHPIMPERTAEIWRQLGLSTPVDGDWEQALQWGRFESGTVTKPGAAVFPRIELPAPA